MYTLICRYVSLILFFSFPLFGRELPFSLEGENRVGRIFLRREKSIDQSSYLYLKFALEHFEKEGCSAVILHLDTPGGEVFAAEKIVELLKRSPLPVVAYIDSWAISAGAMLAYSCKTIVTTPSSSMGAAEPVMMQNQKMESAPEKIRSALRSEFSNLARYHGRNPFVAEAMVDQDLILVKREGEILKLNSSEEIKTDDEILSPKGKLLTLNGEDLKNYSVSDHLTENLYEEIPNLTLIDYSNWKVTFFSVLSHPFVSSLLMMGLLVGFYLEMQTPGLGLFGFCSFICLVLITLSQFAVSCSGFLEWIFIALGLVLILVEFLALPTLGVSAVLGTFFLLGGLVALGEPGWRQIEFSEGLKNLSLGGISFFNALKRLFLTLFSAFFLMVFISRLFLPRSKFFKKFILEEAKNSALFFPLPSIGKKGIALSCFRPFGVVEVEGESFEAFSIGGFIDKGEKVRIVSVKENQLMIRAE